MKSSSSRIVRLCGILVALLGVLGGTAYWYGPDFAEVDAGQSPSTSDSHRGEIAGGEPADGGDVATIETIEFPRDMWEPAGLQIQTAQKATLADSIELTGKITLNEDKLAHVFPLVEGRVDAVKVGFGQRVKKGDLLVVVQSKEVGQGMLQLFQDRLNLEFAKAKQRWVEDVGENTRSLIEMMRGGASIEDIEQTFKNRTMGDYRESLMTAYIDHLTAQAHMERLSPLSKNGVVPARQVLEAESKLNAASAALQSLLEQIAQDTVQESRLAAQTVRELETHIAISETNLKILGFDDADLSDIDPARQGEQLAHYPVTAPFDGTVISKDVVLLERVSPERQILTIADLSTVWVTADIYESHLPLLAQLSDQTIRVRCNAWPERHFEARIFYTGDVVQESTRTIALRAEAVNDDRLLKPGMFVTVELPNLNPSDVLQVPLTAIQNHQGQSFVFVQTGEETFTRRDVTVGRRNRRAVEIRTGLQADDRVVVDGGFALKSKMLADLLAE